ncbi:MAG TPA: hypothetical protein VJA94_16185, partial [Candidatus Angelobacter sp.]
GINRCPSDIADYLTSIGGQTPFGEPIWRLVLADSVIWKVAGGKVWDENLSIAERSEIRFAGAGAIAPHKPLKDETGKLVERRRYPHLDGWILQRWFPPSSYSRSQWFAPENCLPDGTPKLGPFPQFGDYEMVAGPAPRVPSRSELHTFISSYYRGLESRSGSVEGRIRQAVNAAEYERRKEEDRVRELADAYMRDKCSYLYSSSLEAGRIRTDKAEKLGIKEHVGN